jgi:GTPase
MQHKPIVAIVGRPNVGKSSLFNRLIGQKKAVVEDFPGTTRDRLYGDVEWVGRTFTLVDTGGISDNLDKADAIGQGLKRQIQAAVDEADVLLFMVDGQVPPTVEDDHALTLIRKTRKPVVLVVNKLDDMSHEPELVNYYQLGVGEPFGISALAGRATGDLLDKIISLLPNPPLIDDMVEDKSIKIAIIGRPNVGKSTLVNQLLEEERVVVSDIPGTTRDTIDVKMEHAGQEFTLLDTAGIRKRGKIDAGIEHYSVLRAMHAVERADVVFVLFDASEGIVSQDEHVLGYALDNYKSILLVANKWDLMKDKHLDFNLPKDQMIKQYERSVKDNLKYIDFVPFLTISALQDIRVTKLLDLGKHLYDQRFIRLTEAQLRTVLQRPLLTAPLPSKRGIDLHIHKYKQCDVNPPTFLFDVNDAALFHFSVRRLITNAIRKVYPFDGTPFKFIVKTRSTKTRGPK